MKMSQFLSKKYSPIAKSTFQLGLIFSFLLLSSSSELFSQNKPDTGKPAETGKPEAGTVTTPTTQPAATPAPASDPEEDNYVSPMKTGGLTPDYMRSMFFEPELSKKVANHKKAWLNDWVRVGAYVRPRYEDRYNLAFDKSNKGYTSRAMQTSQVFFIIDPSPYFSAKVTVQDARVWGGETPASVGDVRANTFDGAGVTTTGNVPTATSQTGTNIPSQTTIREAFIMLKKLPLDAKVQVGRQVLAYGDQRMLGGANWTINGLSYDGARVMFDQDKFNVHFFATKIAANQNGVNGVISANAPVTYKDPTTGKTVTVNPGQPDQYIVGTYNTIKFNDWFLVDLYSIGDLTKKTSSAGIATDSDLNPNNGWAKQQSNLWTNGFRISNRTAGNNLPKEGPWGGWDWTLEGALQSGATGQRVDNQVLGQTVTQTVTVNGQTVTEHLGGTKNQKYSGQFYVFQTGYTFFQKLRVGAQYIYASGDHNRKDGSSSTFQTLTNPRFGVFPYWNNVGGLSENLDTKNLSAYTVNLQYKTDHFGTFFASYFINNKAQTQDAWYAINGSANTGATTEMNAVGQTTVALGGRGGRNIYNEFDLTWMYMLNDYVSIWIGGGILSAGNAVKNERNAIFSYNLQTGAITANNSVLAGTAGTASQAHMFFFQVNAGF